MSVSKLSVYAIAASGLFAACSGANTSPPVIPSVASTNALAVDSSLRSNYRALPLPTGFVPAAIMKDGQIPGSINGNAAVYRDGALTILGQYGGEPTYATSVNDFGVAVGYAGPTWPARVVEYLRGAFIALPDVSNCPAYIYDDAVIDDAGDIYGSCLPQDLSDEPYIARYKPGTPSLLTGPAFNRGHGLDINASGTFIYSAAAFASDAQAVSGTGLNVTALQIAGYTYSSAVAINSSGTIVGTLTNIDTYTPTYAYIYRKRGPLTVLPMFGNATSMQASGINDSGTVMGSWSNATSSGTFLYKSGAFANVAVPITPTTSIPGFANSGAFVAGVGSQYYLLKPVRR